MSFLHPGWLTLLLILPFILLGAILTHRGRNKAWKHLVAPRLHKLLVRQTSHTRRWVSLSLGLAACALVITAIARPHSGETSTTEQIRTRNILIAIDTSRSMQVRDGSPSRMATAKAMAIELIQAFPNDRIGVIAFSGTPVLMAPLTIDHTSVHETLSQLDTEVIPSGGSNLPATVQLAIKTFRKTGQKSNALIIISDGEDHSQQATTAADAVSTSGLTVCSIGVGTQEGGIIPDPRRNDGKFRDFRGHTVHSQMIPDTLEQLARAGNGTFVPATSGADSAIRAALSSLSSLDSTQQRSRSINVPTERFQWFLLPAILLLILSLLIRSHLFSPPPLSTTTASLILLLTATPLHLLTATPLDHAKAAYDRQDYQTALDLFSKALPESHGENRRSIQFAQGTSAYRLKQWRNATHHFSLSLLTKNTQLRAQSHYNLGNALLQQTSSQLKPIEPVKQPDKENQKRELSTTNLDAAITTIEDAITHYQATLDIKPNHTDALHNKTEAEKLLKQLKEQKKQSEQQNKQDKHNPPPSSDQQKDPNEKDNQDNQDNGDNKPDEQGGAGQKQDDKKQPNSKESPSQQEDDQKNDRQQPPPQQDNNEQQHQQKKGESKEAFAARILKEQSDAETRPVQQRLLRLRRSAKDW